MSRRVAFSPQALAVLAALVAQPVSWRHGYDLAGETGLKSGTLYPILIRLADREMVEACWEDGEPAGRPRRHLYRLTPDGLAAATAALAAAPPAGAVAGERLAGPRRPAPGRRGVVMEQVTGMLAAFLRAAERLLPSGRRPWAEALRAEAARVSGGWPRFSWLAGGLWLVAKEAYVVRKVMYWIGVAAVAAIAAWTIWLSWRAVRAPYVDPQTVTDRVRILAGVAAIVVLPWVGRSRGWFGPVANSVVARLVRLAGCAAMCGLGVIVVRMDSHLQHGASAGPFSVPREIIGLLLAAGAALAVALPPARSRLRTLDTSTLWALAAISALIMLAVLPLQALSIGYVAVILSVTSRRSAVTTMSLFAGTCAGLASGFAIWAVLTAWGDGGQGVVLIVAAMTALLAVPAGLVAAWAVPDAADREYLRVTRMRQGSLAGAVAGGVCGLVLTYFSVVAVFMMLVGPMLGAAAGVAAGALAAQYPIRPRLDDSWAAGLFVLVRAR